MVVVLVVMLHSFAAAGSLAVELDFAVDMLVDLPLVAYHIALVADSQVVELEHIALVVGILAASAVDLVAVCHTDPAADSQVVAPTIAVAADSPVVALVLPDLCPASQSALPHRPLRLHLA